MSLLEILTQAGGLQSVARDLGLGESKAVAGAEALLPAILGGMKTQVQAQSGGLDGLSELLRKLGGGELHDQVLSPQPTDPNRFCRDSGVWPKEVGFPTR